MEFQALRDDLVLAALPHVVFDGWSMRVLAEAAVERGLDPSMAERAFLNGPIDAVVQLSDLGDRLMEQAMAGQDLEALKVPDRIALAVRLRLERWAGEREAIRRALALLALNPSAAAQATMRTVDAMWRAAGDNSHDFSWYTRRATLAAVYSATLLYWLEDDSEGAAETWAFLSRRLGDVGRITRTRKKVEGWLSRLPQPGRLGLARQAGPRR